MQEKFLDALVSASKEISWRYLRDSGDGLGMFFDRKLTDPLNAVGVLNRHTASTGIRLRFGIHFGEVILGHKDSLDTQKPYGDAMNLGARVMSMGKGGHVLLSNEYVEMLTSSDPTVHSKLYDLGKIRVKGSNLHLFNYWDGTNGRPELPALKNPY